ncbi:hypothetical protein JCM10908_002297 [Rhodotorula pacifica]|uniref:uncharacterized protein n=1 Tax=Rhodotorula pacifica TaxID=1495444 RepID=UPI0031821265
MGPLATLFCRRGADSPTLTPGKKKQHSTLDVQLPVSPTSPATMRETGPASGWSAQERRFGPRLPREAGPSSTFCGTSVSDPSGAGQGQQAAATFVPAFSGLDTLAQRVEALRLQEETTMGPQALSSPSTAFLAPNATLTQSRWMGTTRLGHSDAATTPPYQLARQPALEGAGASTRASPIRPQPLVPFSHAVRAIRVSSAPAVSSLPASDRPSLPPPPPYSALDSRASSSLLPTRPLPTAVTPPTVPPRPRPRPHTGSAPVPPPPIRHSVSSPSRPVASTEGMTRQTFCPVPAPPTPPPRLLVQSYSAPVLQQQSHSQQPEVGRSDGPRGSPLRQSLSGDGQPPHLSSSSSHARKPATRPQPKIPSSKSFPSSILPAARLPLLPSENELPPPRSLSRSIGSPPTSSSAPTTPIRKTARRSEPASASSPPSPARSTPASARRAAKSSATRQCDGITAQSKRCTRMVQLAQWTGAARSDDFAGESSREEASNEPVYCKQHAKLALVESGCFLSAQRRGFTSQREERWITFSDWIEADLPIETQALLRHYMTKPVSQHDQEGYIYVHELVPRGSSGASPSQRRPTQLDPTAHIKLGRTLKPIARLSQWRATCPSREPIVRFAFPRAPLLPAHDSSPAPRHAQFAPRGTKNHHRWERLCLVELAGRAIASPEDEQKCTDCGAKHVECFRIERRALCTGAADWNVEGMVEKWQRWCRDVLA